MNILYDDLPLIRKEAETGFYVFGALAVAELFFNPGGLAFILAILCGVVACGVNTGKE